LRIVLVAGNVIGLADPLAVLGQQVMHREFAFVPGLVALCGDVTEAQLRDIEVGGIAAGRTQRRAIDFRLIRTGPRQMVAVARSTLGRGSRSRADPNRRGGAEPPPW